MLKQFRIPMIFLVLARPFFVEIRIRIIAIYKLSRAEEMINEVIIVIDDESENIRGEALCNFGGNRIAVPAIIRKNAGPSIDQRPDQEFAVSFVGQLCDNLADGLNVVSPDNDGIKPCAHGCFYRKLEFFAKNIYHFLAFTFKAVAIRQMGCMLRYLPICWEP